MHVPGSSVASVPECIVANRMGRAHFLLTELLAGMQLSTLGFVWPCLLLTYLGQASYLIRHPEAFSAAYYSSIPHSLFWPMFVLAVMAAIIASQVHSCLNAS